MALNLENLRICKRCVLPESKPNIFLNDEGICNICIEHDKAKITCDPGVQLETDFIKIINKHKGKSKYDCLVMCSGGKDSSSSLYYMTRRYKLNPLAFTFDHGFETEEALENVKNAVESLGVDFLFFKSDYMKEMFTRILKTDSKAVICHPCSIWYMQLAFDIAARFDIPMIVAGWTKGQSTKQGVMSKCGCNIHAPEFYDMSIATIDFLNKEIPNMPKYKDFPRSMDEVLKKAQKKHKAIVISPHWFLPFGEDEYVETIKNEMKWEFPKVSYPKKSTNCSLNFISVYNSMRFFGYTHYHVEMSKHIREGFITREEALKNLQIDFDMDFLNSIAKKLDFKF
jgi:hypothetical protein